MRHVHALKLHGRKVELIPQSNARELDELPVEVRDALDTRPVRTMDEVLELALVAPLQATRGATEGAHA